MPQIDRKEGRQLFGSDPAGYDTARPGHPDRVYDMLVERCGLGPGTSVLEIGPGTGQATRRLLELGADPIIAVEPDPILAEYLTDRTSDRVDVIIAPLEEADLPASRFDLAVAASSFHWVEENVGLSKLRATLCPGGWVALWWTLFGDDERPDPFSDAIDSIVRDLPASPHEGNPDRPRFPLDVVARTKALDTCGFELPEHELIRWTHEWDTAGIRALFATFSPIARLEEAPRKSALDEIARVARHEFGGRVSKPLLTSLFVARRIV